MAEPDVRKGMPPVKLPRDEFEKRYRSRFVDPAFKPLQRELDAIVAVGYMEPYATSHQALDEDLEFRDEVRNAARALGNAVRLARAGKFENPAKDLVDPNPK